MGRRAGRRTRDRLKGLEGREEGTRVCKVLSVRCDHVHVLSPISLVSLMSTYSATYPSHRLIVSTLVTPRWVDRLVAAAGMMDPHAPSQRERRGGKGGGEEEKQRRGEEEKRRER